MSEKRNLRILVFAYPPLFLMMISTDILVPWFTEQWNKTPGDIPAFTYTYNSGEKMRREAIASGFYDRIRSMKEALKSGDKGQVTDELIPELNAFLTTVYDFPPSAGSLVINRQFFGVSKTFCREAKAFDGGLTREEIYQALRNVWIMNGLQLLMNLPVEITPAVFAYSLLYPYSDNLLDDPGLSGNEKAQFCARFEKMIRGIPVRFADGREAKIRALLKMIEGQYERASYPEVYESLLAIHKAQTQGISLQKEPEKLTAEQVMDLSFAKGGTSVLADGYLVAGKLTPQQQRFLFGYGIWLQLADDIQDITEDRSDNVRTLFTPACQNGATAAAFNRAVYFGRLIIRDIGSFPDPGSSAFGKLMVQSVETMMMQSAGLHADSFSNTFISRLENHSPLRFEFLREMRRKGSPTRLGFVTSVM